MTGGLRDGQRRRLAFVRWKDGPADAPAGRGSRPASPCRTGETCPVSRDGLPRAGRHDHEAPPRWRSTGRSLLSQPSCNGTARRRSDGPANLAGSCTDHRAARRSGRGYRWRARDGQGGERLGGSGRGDSDLYLQGWGRYREGGPSYSTVCYCTRLGCTTLCASLHYSLCAHSIHTTICIRGMAF